MRYYENYPNFKDYMANFLNNKEQNRGLEALHRANFGRKPHIDYFTDNTEVCRKFFELAMRIDHRVVDDIACLVLGMDERPRQIEQNLRSPATPAKHSQIGIFKAF